MLERRLKSRQYYEDLYDRQTVDFCRWYEKRYQEALKIMNPKKFTEKDRAEYIVHELAIYFETGERYLQRDKIINKWINDDKKRDEFFENAIPPKDIYCNTCGVSMIVELETPYIGGLHEEDRMLFFFHCPRNCKTRRALFENGDEWSGTNQPLSEEEKGVIISIEDPKDDKSFNCGRVKFCLDKKYGEKYREQKSGLERIHKIMEDIREKEKNKELYERLAKLKKLTIVELEKILKLTLKTASYIKFELGKPEIKRDVIVEFTTQDEKLGRNEYNSKNELKKLINETLENTNWRLMSNGINYRLGILSGQLRGYENEDDLIKISTKKLD